MIPASIPYHVLSWTRQTATELLIFLLYFVFLFFCCLNQKIKKKTNGYRRLQLATVHWMHSIYLRWISYIYFFFFVSLRFWPSEYFKNSFPLNECSIVFCFYCCCCCSFFLFACVKVKAKRRKDYVHICTATRNYQNINIIMNVYTLDHFKCMSFWFLVSSLYFLFFWFCEQSYINTYAPT